MDKPKLLHGSLLNALTINLGVSWRYKQMLTCTAVCECRSLLINIMVCSLVFDTNFLINSDGLISNQQGNILKRDVSETWMY